MADIELVIKIPEDDYKHIKEYYEKNDIVEATYSYIYHGTPLSKGHGDLYDYNDLSKLVGEDFRFFLLRLDLNLQQPIIKADKEYEVKVISRGNCMICGKELTEGLFICKECGEKANKESEDKE